MIEVNFNCSQYNRSSSFDQSITFVKFLESIGIFLRIFLKISISITTNRHSHFDSRRRYAWNLVHQIRRPPPSIDSHILNLIFSPCQPRSSYLSFFLFPRVSFLLFLFLLLFSPSIAFPSPSFELMEQGIFQNILRGSAVKPIPQQVLRSSFPEERKGEREREGGKEEKKEGRERGRRKERKKEKEKGNDRKSRLCTRSVWRSLPRYFRGDESQMSKSNSTRHRGNERFSYRTDQIERIFGRVFSIRVRICPCIGGGGGMWSQVFSKNDVELFYEQGEGE